MKLCSLKYLVVYVLQFCRIAKHDTLQGWEVLTNNDASVAVVVEVVDEAKPVDHHARPIPVPVAPELLSLVVLVMIVISKKCLGFDPVYYVTVKSKRNVQLDIWGLVIPITHKIILKTLHM